MSDRVHRIAALIDSARERTLRTTLEQKHALRLVPLSTFQRIKRACLVSLVVMDLNDPGTDIAGALLEVRSRWPTVPVVGYAPPHGGSRAVASLAASSLPDVVSAGVTVVDGSVEALHRAIADALGRQVSVSTVVAAFERELRALRSPWVADFCRACLAYPRDATTVGAVSKRIDGSRQHIASEFHRTGMGSPGHFVTIARLIHAVERATRTGDPWADVAPTLGWSSSDALRRSLQRNAGLTAVTGMTARGRDHIYGLARQFLTVG